MEELTKAKDLVASLQEKLQTQQEKLESVNKKYSLAVQSLNHDFKCLEHEGASINLFSGD